MKKPLLTVVALALSLPLAAADTPHPAPGEIVAQAAAEQWVAIPAGDLLVMTLATDAEGSTRQVVIQLMPAPFSQGWTDNIRLLARSGWYDNISVNRVQDNYVVQWGDPNYDNPEATGATKTLPKGLRVIGEAEYVAPYTEAMFSVGWRYGRRPVQVEAKPTPPLPGPPTQFVDPYSTHRSFALGFPVGFSEKEIVTPDPRFDPKLNYTLRYNVPEKVWPLHCYGMVGVGRNLSPDTGSGAELYTVIGHAPRHLDRNIALVGRVIEGMEHLSSLPRGKGALGFYGPDEVNKRTPILSVRVASDLAPADQPRFEYLNTEGETFARYAEARANRRDPFFNAPAGGADICNIPVPIRRVAE